MRYLFVILLFISTGAFAQKKDEASLIRASDDLVTALQKKDSFSLNHLLNDNVFYGHSNGWIENKREVVDDLFNGKLTYKKMLCVTDTVRIEGDKAWLRMSAIVDVELNGKAIQLTLKVLEVWIWENKHWMLFARQSTKI